VQTPVIDDVFSTRLGVDWIEEPLRFYVGNTDTLDDFTGCTLAGGIYNRGTLVLDMSTGTSRTSITLPSTVNISVPAADIASVGPGNYIVALALVTPANGTQDLVSFTLQVNEP